MDTVSAPDPAETERRIEALLFAAAGPLSLDDLARRLPEGSDVERGIAELRARYAGRGVELACVGDRWRFQTAPDLAFLMTLEREEPRRLSRAAQETLAIIAYHQPVTRAEIEAVRGVQASRGTLDVLLELKLAATLPLNSTWTSSVGLPGPGVGRATTAEAWRLPVPASIIPKGDPGAEPAPTEESENGRNVCDPLDHCRSGGPDPLRRAG